MIRMALFVVVMGNVLKVSVSVILRTLMIVATCVLVHTHLINLLKNVGNIVEKTRIVSAICRIAVRAKICVTVT